MSAERPFLVAFLVFTAVYVTHAGHKFRHMIYEEISNSTMCPIKVHINDDPSRTPQELRFIQCAEHPNRLCAQEHVPDLCCKTNSVDYYAECVEVHDYVQVQYAGSAQPDMITVPVGCACIVGEPIKATEPE